MNQQIMYVDQIFNIYYVIVDAYVDVQCSL